ncbi:MAG: hypothetical protein WC100_01640 [Sterolibacterium sp.]
MVCITVPLMVAAAAVGAVGSIQAGNAASAAGKFNSQVSTNNAEIARRNATFAGQEGEIALGNQGMKAAAKTGKILTEQASSGVDVNSGSSLAVRDSQKVLDKQDAATIRSNAARKAYGFQVDQANDMSEAQLYRSKAKADKTAGYINATSTILGGAANASQAGGFGGGGEPSGNSYSDFESGHSINEGLGGLY